MALLQEAPPHWRDDLARASGAAAEVVMTSRNCLAPVRVAIADRNPDLIGASAGGSNMLLVRPPFRAAEVDRVRLATWPERRKLLMARIDVPARQPRAERALVVACTHLSVPATGRGAAEALRAAATATDWAAGAPVVLGGDLNLRPADHGDAFAALAERHRLAPPTAPRSLDHLLARDLAVVDPPHVLPPSARDVPGPGGLAIRLSDHAPVTAAFGL